MEMRSGESSSLLRDSGKDAPESLPYGLKRKNGKSLVLALVVLLALFVATTIALAAVLAYRESTRDDENSELSNVCTTATCIEAASFLTQGLNTSVDPCDNFYKYSCGNWEGSNVLPEGFGRYSTFDELSISNSIALKKALEQSVPQGDDGAVSKARYMYAKCMDLENLNRIGADPLKDIVTRLGGWELINEDESMPGWSLNGSLYREHYYGSDAFFTLSIQADDLDSSVVTIKVYIMTTELPLQVIYTSVYVCTCVCAAMYMCLLVCTHVY